MWSFLYTWTSTKQTQTFETCLNSSHSKCSSASPNVQTFILFFFVLPFLFMLGVFFFSRFIPMLNSTFSHFLKFSFAHSYILTVLSIFFLLLCHKMHFGVFVIVVIFIYFALSILPALLFYFSWCVYVCWQSFVVDVHW